MRHSLTREGLEELMKELGRSAPGNRSYRVLLLGGATAVHQGWRVSTIDADLYSDCEEVFGAIQEIKERLQLNIEFVRPEDFVPALQGSEERHVFIETVGRVSFYHYDPYAQLLSMVVRGFRRDLEDATRFLDSGLVEEERFRSLVSQIAPASYARYPTLSQAGVLQAVDDFLPARN